MNNGDNDSRIRKYTFDDTVTNANKSRQNNNRIWPIIIFIVVVAGLILAGVKTITYFTSSSHSNQSTEMSSQVQNKQSQTDSQNQNDRNQYAMPTKKTGKKTMFDRTHIFSSVADAQNYAKATQDQWLKAGYTNYTVSADSQGYYILKFIK